MKRGRFSAEDILAIRNGTEPGTVLAKRYGVSDALISQIRNFIRYNYVQDDGTMTNPHGCKLTESQVRMIRTTDLPVDILAERFGLSKQMIRRIQRGASYAWVAAE